MNDRRTAIRLCIRWVALLLSGLFIQTAVSGHLRRVIPHTEVPLYKLPLPLAGRLKDHLWFSLIDLADLMALMLLLSLWINVGRLRRPAGPPTLPPGGVRDPSSPRSPANPR